jgi:hypothetical protein
MGTKADSVAIPQVAQHNCRRGVIVVLASLLLSACGSGNPDSLIGMNVDENLAMADTNEMSDANLAATGNRGGDSAADSQSPKETARAAKGSLLEPPDGSSAEVNADDVATNPPTQDEKTTHASEEPNAT